MKNEHDFKALTPISNANLGIYENALDYALHNNKIKNIAITGPFGSGKSSILETYKSNKRGSRKKYINVVLTGFKDNDTKCDRLEGKILNQLIHQVNPNKIPLSDFKPKKQNYILNILFFAVTWIYTLFVGIIFILSKYNNSNSSFEFLNKLNSPLKSLYTNQSYAIHFGSILLVLAAVWTFILLKKQYEKSFLKSISLQGNELEVFQKDDDEYFDKYLNEIMYILKRSNVKVIVFEDLDRFAEVEIFERLRELNFLINNKYNSANIKFIYLLKDDIFISKNRTKFFDFIIPVIPIVDSSNSYEEFYMLFQKFTYLDPSDNQYISKGLLGDLALYVDELRLVYNIYNEFTIYRKKLEDELEDESFQIIYKYSKLLSIIVYKNIFPSDFTGLQFKKGLVYLLLSLTNEHNEIYNTNLTLKDMFTGIPRTPKTNKAPKDYIASIFGNSPISFDKVATETLQSEQVELIIGLLANGCIDNQYTDYLTYFYANSLTTQDKLYLKSFVHNLQYNSEFSLKRVDEITRRLENNPHRFSQHQVLNFDLLYYLLQNEHIHTTDVINLIIKEKCYSFILEFVNFIYSKINYIIEDTPTFNWCVLGQKGYLYNSPELYESEKALKSFIKELNHKSSTICNELIKHTNLNPTLSFFVKDYIIATLCYEDNTKFINQLDIDKCITNLIIEDVNFFEKNSTAHIGFYLYCIRNGMTSLKIKINKFKLNPSNRTLLDEIYKNNLYTINKDMLHLLLSVQYKDITENKILHQNYSSVISEPKQSLVSYIHKPDNINIYISVLLELSNRIINDSSDAAIKLISNTNITKENIIKYISYLKTTLPHLHELPEPYFTLVLQQNLVEYTEKNILHYYLTICNKNIPFSNNLINFINSDYKNLVFKKTTEEGGSKNLELFLNDAVKSVNLNDERYLNILKSYSVINFNTAGLSDQKMNILIDNNIINFNYSNLKFIRSNYQKFSIRFIMNNIDEYIKLSKDQIIISEINSLLNNNISEDIQNRLIELSQKPITIREKNYNDNLELRIIESKYDPNDLSYIINKYDDVSQRYKTLIIDKVITNFPSVYSCTANGVVTLSDNLIYRLLIYDDKVFNIANKKQLISHVFSYNLFNKIHIAQARIIFNKLNLTELSRVVKDPNGGRFNINLTENTKNWLILLEKNKIINKCTRHNNEYWHVNGLHNSHKNR